MSDPQRIVLDIGGSSIKSGLVTGCNDSGFREDDYDSSADGETILAVYRQVIELQLAAATGEVSEVVLAHPGPFDYENGICLVTGVEKLEGLYGMDLCAALRRDLPPDCGLRFLNDAAAAIRGEALHGAGRPYRRLIGVTLGTGCGSAFVIDGEVVREGEGVAEGGEVYHLTWRDGIADETFSRRGLIQRLSVFGFTGTSVREIGARTYALGLAAFGGDLGKFLAPIALGFQAECVLVLGGIANLYDAFGPALEQNLPVPAVTGELGQKAPLLGA